MDFELVFKAKAGELRPQHNDPGQSSTRENVYEYDPNPHTLVNIRIDTVQYGSYEGKPAALIVFRFIFKFRPGSRRIRNFHSRIEFRAGDAPTQGTGLPNPKVIRLAPEERRGKIFMEERSNTVTGGLQVPLGPSGAQAHVQDEVARKINREYELKLAGWKTSSDVATDNVLVWDCTEANKAAKGVVPGYRGATIVQHSANKPFIATVDVDAQHGVFDFARKAFDYLSFFAKKELDDPVMFDPTKPMGHQYPNLADFKDLNLDDLIKLEPIQVLPSGYS